jgi:hypothetical protein
VELTDIDIGLIYCSAVDVECAGSDMRTPGGSLPLEGVKVVVQRQQGEALRAGGPQSPGGRRRIDRLLREADVSLHNWRPGFAERLQRDAARVCRQFPHLVDASISGFGDAEPRSAGPDFDSLLQAASGLAAYEGDGGVPRLARLYLADKVAATFATQAVPAGLLARRTGGRGP